MIDNYDFDFITPRLATGAAPVDAGFVEALAKAGITHVIDVTDATDDTSLLATHPNILYCFNPTADDGSHKAPEWFAKSLTFALPAFALPHAKLYAHCSAGINRGPSTAYVTMRALGWTPTDAMALLRAHRPQVKVAYAADADAAIKVLGFE
jgi:predicted protein tyrosine phosphatase